ncbi:MAG: hypothetical protein J7K63_08995 [Candidatus Marinimicrobia bacterium]|nr:hypothetical protein [Candidatus Neomarinimicrobiota bacterium]
MKRPVMSRIVMFLGIGFTLCAAAPVDKDIYILDFENKTDDASLDWLEKGLSEMIFQEKFRLPGLILHPEYTMSEAITFREQDPQFPSNRYILMGSIYHSSAEGDILIHLSSIHIKSWQTAGESSFTAYLSDKRALKSALIHHLAKLYQTESLDLDFTVNNESPTDEGYIDTETLEAARRELLNITTELGKGKERESKSHGLTTLRPPAGTTVLRFNQTEAKLRLDMERENLNTTSQAIYELLQNPYLVQINEPNISTLPYRPHRGTIRIEVSYQLHPDLLEELTDILPFQQVDTENDYYYSYLTFQADYSDIPFQLQRDIQLGHYRTIPVIELTDGQGRIIHTFIDGQYLDLREINRYDGLSILDNFKPLLIMTSSRSNIQLYVKQAPYVGVYELELPVSLLESLAEVRVQFYPILELYDRY